MLESDVIGFPEDGRIGCRFWEDECVIYNQYTGDTHLIEMAQGAELFKSVAEKISTPPGLLQRIESIFDLPPDFDVEAVLNKLIEEYLKLELLIIKESRTH